MAIADASCGLALVQSGDPGRGEARLEERYAENAGRSRLTVRLRRMVSANVRVKRMAARLALPILLGIGAGFTGPFGTYVYAPTLPRMLYWVVVILLSFGIWDSLRFAGRRIFSGWPDRWGEVIIAIPFSFLNALALVSLHRAVNSAFSTFFPTVWSDFVVSHILISVLVVVPTIALARQLLSNAGSAAGSEAIRFITEKLPPRLRGSRPQALEAEGNYVRVYTDAGNDLVLSTFEDALRAVSGIDGIQTHRSWWVAKSEMVALAKSGSSYELETKSGVKVPVGRRRRAAISEILEAL